MKPLVSLLSLLLYLNPSLPYSLKNCTIDYSVNPTADVFLNCANRKLCTVPDDIPRDVSSIKLDNNIIEKINRDDFSNLSKLKSLYLQINWISHVDDGSFIDLGALTVLEMSGNYLTNLTANLFQGLSSLTVLSLRWNEVQFIHTLAFQSLTSLQTVILLSNQLQQISDIQPLLQLPHLQKLNIIDNQFTSFDTKDLLNMSSSLKVLYVSSEKLKTFSISTPVFPQLETINLCQINSGTFVRWDVPDKTLLKSITQLLISNTWIPFEEIQNVLQSLESLIHLKLSYMDEWIVKGLLETVCKIQTLTSLDLSHSNVTNLSAKLVTCSQLSDLDLSNTHMTELPKGSILSLKRLRFMTVKTNSLTKVPDDIRSLSSLEILNLSDNLISELGCDDFTNTTHLIELYLNMNNIVNLHRCVLEKLNDLKVLDMSNNLLRTFGGAFKITLQKLEFLNLRGNSVSFFEKGDFQGLGSLKHLDVTNIEKIRPGAFDGLVKLESLRISVPPKLYYNYSALQQLKSYHFDFPYEVSTNTIYTMKYLESFTAENIYVSAPNGFTFHYHTHLKNLTIRQTDMSDLDPMLFETIPNLQVLDFSNCYLKSLDFLVKARPPALRFLNLSNNELTVINETVFQSLPALTHLDLGNNPFTCDCSNAGFIQWVMSNAQTQVVNAHQYTCSFPVAQQGRKLLEFNTESCWMDVSFICFISSTCLVVLALLSSFIYHFLRWQLSYGFYLFLAFLYDSRKKKKGTPHQFDAFVSYNVHDEAWVYREMLPVLEEEQGWRLCLHHRDFQPGKPIMENITDAIYSSKKTICVISRRYLQSDWCSREIQMASFRLFDEQKDVLILLFLEEIPTQQMSPYYRMRKLVKRRTYLSWPQAGQHTGVFWQNVQRALETGNTPDDTNLLSGPTDC
uniref:TIR domain-containing protein n=1 Tax=Anabas testudineus TaxID=64144 RepID=A0A3Q1JSJ8_ANATE